MQRTNFALPSSFRLGAAAAVLGLAGLTGCMVVPLEPSGGAGHATTAAPVAAAVVVAPPPAPVTFAVRLYPANEAAARHGVVSAVVTNDLHGKGTFNTAISGEVFAGEATRKAGSSREGVAAGAGHRGGYLSCAYTMNDTTRGTGQCRLSDGAVFNMHMGR